MTTGEIIFNSLNTDDIIYRIGCYKKVFFYMNGKLMFNPPFNIYSPISSYIGNDLGLHIHDTQFFLNEIYHPIGDWMSSIEKAKTIKKNEENSKKRKKELDVFIKYLREAGKIVQ